MYDFVSIGEILIDFAPEYRQDSHVPLFQPNPGGAPANVACALAKLGDSTAFIGKVGNDAFGRSCLRSLQVNGVDTHFVAISDQYPTTVTFVCLDENGNRNFSFYRDNTADVNISLEDLKDGAYTDTNFFHFGSVSLTSQPARDATVQAVKAAKNAGCTISFDPNLRLPLWNSPDDAREAIYKVTAYADILKISEEEGQFLFGSDNCDEIFKTIQKRFSIPTVVISRAAKGCYAAIGEKKYKSFAYDLKTIDTTGAGDAFLGGLLHYMLKSSRTPNEMTDKEINEMLDFANAIGSLATTKKGAIPAIPTLPEIESCMRTCKRLYFD